MPTIVEVKGYGEVEFPDSMTEAEMAAALKKGPWNKPAKQLQLSDLPIQPPTGTGMYGEPIGANDSSFTQAIYGKPLQYAGKALDVSGKLLYGGLVDEMEHMFLPGEHRRQQELEARLPGYEEPMGNVESMAQDLAQGETPRDMPAYEQLRNLSPFDQFIGSMGRGTVESAPRLALAAATAPVLGPYGSGALAFGLSDEEGGVNLKQAAIGAGIPFAGRWFGEGAALLAKGIGVADWEARNAVRAWSSMAGPGVLILGEQLHTIEGQVRDGIITPEEAKRAKLDAWASATGMASFGPMHPKYEGRPNRPPIIPQREPGAPKLSPIAGYEGLTQLEQAHLNKARETVTQPIVVKMEQPGIEYTAEADQPFARKDKTSSGPGEYVLRANRATGQIEIYQGALQRWLESVPEHKREAAMKTALGEEVIHHSITRNMAMELWDSMGPVSRAITAKLYTGRFSGIGADGKPVSVADLADEAARIRMQMLSRLGPREVAEAAFKDQWTMQSLVAIQHMINFATEGISGSEGSRRDIVRRMQQNLQAARSTVEFGKVPDGLFMQRKEQGELPLEGRVAAALSMSKSASDDPNKVIGQQELDLWSKPTGERTANASEVSQAAEVHGNLQPQPGQGHEEVPVQKGGEGVQPQAEGRVLEPEQTGPWIKTKPGEFEAIMDELKKNLKGGRYYSKEQWRAAIKKVTGEDTNTPGMIRKNQRDFMDDAETFAHEFKVADPEVFMRQLGRHLAGEPTKSDEQQKLFDEFAARHPEYEKFFNAPGMMRKTPSFEDIPETPEAVGDRVLAIIGHTLDLEDAGKFGEMIKSYKDSITFAEAAKTKMTDKMEAKLQPGAGDEGVTRRNYERTIEYLDDFIKDTNDRIQQHMAGEGSHESFPAMRRKDESTTGLVNEQQKRLLKQFNDAANIVAGRNTYGYRVEDLPKNAHRLIWSNSARRWVASSKAQVGELQRYRTVESMKRYLPANITKVGENQVILDANEIVITANGKRDAQLIADSLPPLPLDKFSAENNPLLENRKPQSEQELSDRFERIADFYGDREEMKLEDTDVVQATSDFMDKIRSPEQTAPGMRRKDAPSYDLPNDLSEVIPKLIQFQSYIEKLKGENAPKGHVLAEYDNVDFWMGTIIKKVESMAASKGSDPRLPSVIATLKQQQDRVNRDAYDYSHPDEQSFPAMRRKPKPGDLQTGLDFEGRTGAPPPPEPTLQQTGASWRSMTPEIMGQTVAEHIQTARNPTFEGFVKMATERWNVTRGQLVPAWRDHYINALFNSTGEQLKSMLYRLNLGRQEKIKFGTSMMEVNHPSGGVRSGKAVGDVADNFSEPIDLQYVMGAPKGTQAVVAGRLRFALQRAKNAKLREAEYYRMLAEAKAKRSELKALGFSDVNEQGKLVKAETPLIGPSKPATVNEQSLGLAKELFALRDRMDYLQDPQRESRKETRKTVRKRRGVMLENPELGGESQATVRAPGVTLLEEGEVKPVEDETARPGFQAGMPTPVRKMSKETRAKEDRRLRILSALIPELEAQTETSPTKLNRKRIEPEELALHKGPDVIRQIKPDESTELGLVQAIATAAPEIDASTVVHKVIGGQKVSTSKEAPAEAETKNILVVRDVNGRIFALSVYKASDGTVRVMDPYSPSLKRAHVPLDKSFIYKFNPIYHLSLDEPVRNFIQEFKNRDQFRNEILLPTRGLLSEAATRQKLLEISTPEEIAAARGELDDHLADGTLSPEAHEESVKELNQRESEIENATKASQHPSMYSLGAGMGQMAKALQGRFRAKGLPPERLVTGNEADALYELTKAFHPGEASTPATPESFLELMGNATKDIEAGTLSPQARLALIALQKIETQMTEANDVAGAVSREQIANALSNAAQGGPEMFKDILVRRFGKSEEPPQSLEKLTSRTPGLTPNPVEPTIRTPEELRAGGFEHRMRPPATGQFEHPTPANLPESGKMLPPEQREALAAQQPKFEEPTPEEINQQLVKMGSLSPQEYKYWMGGWPKFKSLGDTPISIFDTPGMMRKLVKNSVDTVNWGLINPSGALIQWYSAWMSRRLRALGGATGNQLADIFDMVIDRTKRHEGELFSQFGDIALREVGAPGPAGTWLNKFNVVHPVLAKNAAIGNVVSATEGWTPVAWTTRGFVAHPIPAYALSAVQALRVANLAAGHLIQTVIPGFLANGSFERHLTPFGYDVVTAGDGPLFHALVNGEAVANGVPYARVRDMYQKLKAELDDPMPDTGRLDNMNQEFKRLLPRAVTHVQVENAGLANGWRQVRHANAFSYLNATLKRAAHMTAFREQFPTGSIGRAVLEQFRKDLYADPTKGHGPFSGSGDSTNQRALRANFDSVVRALQGHPTDQYGTSRITGYEYLRPGAAASEAVRLANATVFNLAAKMVLTKQYIVQIPELLLGSAPSYLGMRNYWQGLTNHRQFYAELERMGAVNRVMYDWSMDPQAPIQSFFKIAGNALSKFTGQNLLNEWQEAAAAATAKVVSERIQSGNLTPWENRQLPNTFKEMGFQPDQINRMMQGDPDVLDMFQRRAAAFLTGGNKHIAEGSRVGANRMVNSIFRFQMYPMMKMNQLRQDWETFSTARTPEARSVALERMARSMFFNVAQGAATAVLGAVTSSTINANVKALDAKHHPFMFLLGSWFNAQSGPLYLLYSAVDRTGMAGVGEQISRMIFPFAVTSDVFDMLNGTGRYKYMDNHERGDEFMRSKLPGMQPIQMGLSYLGLSREDVDLRASRTAFYKWKGKYYPDVGSGSAGETTEADAKFRTHMSQAVKALIRGEDDAFMESVIKATEMKNAKSAAASLRGKKILKDATNGQMDPDAIEALREEIGEKAYGKLEAYDLMLESAAQGIYPSKR